MFLFELLGAVLGFLCVALLIYRNHWSWPIGFAQVVFTAVVLWEAKLYAETGLQVVFAVLQLVGWWSWLTSRSADDPLAGANGPIRVEKLSATGLILSILLTVALTGLLAWFLLTFTDGQAPWIDAFIAAASLTAQVLLAARFHENWGYWIVVDLVSIPLYIHRELYALAILYVLFLCLAIAGWRAWRQSLHDQSTVGGMPV